MERRSRHCYPALCGLGSLLWACFLFTGGCSSTETIPPPPIGSSINEPTIFMSEPDIQPTGVTDVDGDDHRTKEIRTILAECHRPDAESPLGLWKTSEQEVFLCRTAGENTWEFYPLDPFLPGGTTAKGTEKLFLRLSLVEERRFTGEVDGTGVDPDDAMLPVEAHLSEDGEELVLIHDTGNPDVGALSLVLTRGLDSGERLMLEKELSVRFSQPNHPAVEPDAEH